MDGLEALLRSVVNPETPGERQNSKHRLWRRAQVEPIWIAQRLIQFLQGSDETMKVSALVILREGAELLCSQSDGVLNSVVSAIVASLKDENDKVWGEACYTIKSLHEQGFIAAVWVPVLQQILDSPQVTIGMLFPFCLVDPFRFRSRDAMWEKVWRVCQSVLSAYGPPPDLKECVLALLNHVLCNVRPTSELQNDVQTVLFDMLNSEAFSADEYRRYTNLWHFKHQFYSCFLTARTFRLDQKLPEISQVGAVATREMLIPFIVRDLQEQLPVYLDYYKQTVDSPVHPLGASAGEIIMKTIMSELLCLESLVMWYINADRLFSNQQDCVDLVIVCAQLSRYTSNQIETYKEQFDQFETDELMAPLTLLRKNIRRRIILNIYGEDRPLAIRTLCSTLIQSFREFDYSLAEAILEILSSMSDISTEDNLKLFELLQERMSEMLGSSGLWDMGKVILLFRMAVSIPPCVDRDGSLKRRGVQCLRMYYSKLEGRHDRILDFSLLVMFADLGELCKDSEINGESCPGLQKCLIDTVLRLIDVQCAQCGYILLLRVLADMEKLEPLPFERLEEVVKLVLCCGEFQYPFIRLKKCCFEELVVNIKAQMPRDSQWIGDLLVGFTSFLTNYKDDRQLWKLWSHFLCKYTELVQRFPSSFPRFHISHSVFIDTLSAIPLDENAPAVIRLLINGNQAEYISFEAERLMEVFRKLGGGADKAALALWILRRDDGSYFQKLLKWGIRIILKTQTPYLVEIDVLLARLVMERPVQTLSMLKMRKDGVLPLQYVIQRWLSTPNNANLGYPLVSVLGDIIMALVALLKLEDPILNKSESDSSLNASIVRLLTKLTKASEQEVDLQTHSFLVVFLLRFKEKYRDTLQQDLIAMLQDLHI